MITGEEEEVRVAGNAAVLCLRSSTFCWAVGVAPSEELVERSPILSWNAQANVLFLDGARLVALALGSLSTSWVFKRFEHMYPPLILHNDPALDRATYSISLDPSQYSQ